MRAGDTRPLHSRTKSGGSPAVPCPVRPLAPLAFLLALALVAWADTASAAGVVRGGNLGGRERDCAALIAYLEASVEGVRGMQAVVRVVHNRMRDARFASTACAVVGQDGQFQPKEERPALKRAVRGGRPLRLERLLRVDTPFERMLLGQALRLPGGGPGGPPAPGRGARRRPDQGCAVLREPAADGPGPLPLVRGPAPDDPDRRARVHDPLPRGRAAARPGARLPDRWPRQLDDRQEPAQPAAGRPRQASAREAVRA